MRRLALVGVLAVLPLGVEAADADGAAQARQRLAAERAAVQARFDRESADCRQRFDVNTCLGEAKLRRRGALAALDDTQRRLDETARRQRAADRQAEVARRQAEVAQRAAAASGAVAGGPAAALPTPSRQPPAPAAPAGASTAADRAVRAAERAEAARRLQAEIQADQVRIRQRIDKRAAQGRKGAPLPPAPGASATP